MTEPAESRSRAAAAVEKIEAGRRGLEAMARLDAPTLGRSYGPGKWTGAELLAHVADSDLVHYYRFLKVIAEEGGPIVPFDENKWVAELRVKERPAWISVSASAAARAGFRHYLEVLPAEVLARATVHPEVGPLTALQIAERVADHALHHLEQLEAIRDGQRWTPKAV